ncbi:2'-5' RNA ligase family protein [Deinococcus petrolearius]|uniref:2'-5' RNA ligase family protein n=1 Tax=Deinococcus petrolearius TaxID=1751295 RepID=A0ABW1DP24_9DEIO
MTPPGLHLPGPPQALYSVVAWPPPQLDTWLRRQQEHLNVRAFGAPHLNLRAPFQTELRGEALISACRAALAEQGAFEVRLRGWRRVPGIFFLECEPEGAIRDLHRRLLDALPSSRGPHDGDGYRPHLTLALGVLPWAEEELWGAVQALTPPVTHFSVQALTLTREERGEVQELHTFPLEGAVDSAG